MSFTSRSTIDLVQIANAGGGFRLSATNRATIDLVQIANAARNGGGTVYLSGMDNRATIDLIQISNAGGGNIVFEG